MGRLVIAWLAIMESDKYVGSQMSVWSQYGERLGDIKGRTMEEETSASVAQHADSQHLVLTQW